MSNDRQQPPLMAALSVECHHAPAGFPCYDNPGGVLICANRARRAWQEEQQGEPEPIKRTPSVALTTSGRPAQQRPRTTPQPDFQRRVLPNAGRRRR